MNDLLKMPRNFWAQVVYILFIPGFFIAFAFTYNPLSMEELLTVGGHSFSFHYLMLTCIALVTLALSRTVLFFLYLSLKIKWWHYLVWCVSEMFVISCFFALYATLFYAGQYQYFEVLFKAIKCVFLIMSYPYIFLAMARIISNYREELDDRNAPVQGSLVKFYDEHHRLRLTIDPSAILFINAESNYVKIHYKESGRVKEFLLRNSMKSVEEMVSHHGLVRCQRSYFVNPSHVSVLSRNRDGVIVAELTVPGLDPVPVGKQYYETLASIL